MECRGKTFVIDLETLGNAPHGAIVSAAVLVFDLKDRKKDFKDLCNEALYVKFNLKEQKAKGRKIDKDVVTWWKDQSKEAQKELLPSDKDVNINEGLDLITNYLTERGVVPKNSIAFCRGQSFDFPLIVDLYESCDRGFDFPNKFWNQRDTRTYIGTLANQIDIRDIPLPDGTLDGFIHHNAVHDIAKDVLKMRYAEMYAFGEAEIPNE